MTQPRDSRGRFTSGGGSGGSGSGMNLGTAYGQIRIDASGVQSGIQQAQHAFNNGIQSMGQSIQNFGSQFQMLGANLSILTAPILGLGMSFSSMEREFESAFTGVRKTFRGTDEELAALQARIEDMAINPELLTSQLPNAAVELARIAELAGQMGITGVDGIAKFTETIALLQVTTDLTGDSAAMMLSQFSNIMKVAPEDAMNLGSVIVDLGNQLAATESQIMEMGMRIAGAGNVVGMTEREVLAIAGALSSVGINAEAGGSAISRVLLDIESFVATGSEELDTLAAAMGRTPEEFAAAWRDDPVQALNVFIGTLRDMQAEGGNTIGLLEELGFSDIRVRDTMLRLATGEDLLTGAIQIANTAWEENNALTNEARTRSDTTDASITIAMNNFRDLGRIIGKELNKALRQFAQAVIPVIQAVKEWVLANPELVQQILKILGVVSVIGPALLIVGTVISAFGGIISTVGVLLGALLSPIGLIIAAVVGLGIAWQTNFMGIQENLAPVIEWVKTAFDTLVMHVQNLWAAFQSGGMANVGTYITDNFVTPLLDSISSIDWTAVGLAIQTGIGNALSTLSTWAAWAYDNLLTPMFVNVQTAIGSVDWNAIGTSILTAIGTGLNTIGTWVNTNVLQPLLYGLQTINWNEVGATLQTAFGTALSTLGTWATWAYDYILFPLWNNFTTAIASVDWASVGLGIINAIGMALQLSADFGVWVHDNILAPFVANAATAIESVDWYSVGAGIVNAIGTILKTAFDFVAWIIDSIFSPVTDNADAATGEVDWSGTGTSILTAIGNFLRGAFDFIQWLMDNVLSPLILGAADAIGRLDWSSIGQNLMDSIRNALPNIAQWVTDNIITPIRNALANFNPMEAVNTGASNIGTFFNQVGGALGWAEGGRVGYASGGMVNAVVGERGPENVALPVGSQVTPTSGSNMPSIQNMNIYANTEAGGAAAMRGALSEWDKVMSERNFQ